VGKTQNIYLKIFGKEDRAQQGGACKEHWAKIKVKLFSSEKDVKKTKCQGLIVHETRCKGQTKTM
jgi:hypothetical protein